MIEYLYNAVVASAGEDISITAFIDSCLTPPFKSAYLQLSDDDKVICEVSGLYVADLGCWSFKIPAKMTLGLKGRHWYQVYTPDMSVSFKQPIYLK